MDMPIIEFSKEMFDENYTVISSLFFPVDAITWYVIGISERATEMK
jgi:hypothetical protein